MKNLLKQHHNLITKITTSVFVFLFSVGIIYATTTIGENIFSAGNLEVSGNATTTGTLVVGSIVPPINVNPKIYVSGGQTNIFSEQYDGGSNLVASTTGSGVSDSIGIEGYASVQEDMGTSAYGIKGIATGVSTNYGIYGTASGGTTNYAGYFSGDVRVTGLPGAASLAVGPDAPTISHYGIYGSTGFGSDGVSDYGVYGESHNDMGGTNYGVYGKAWGDTGVTNYGIYGTASGSGNVTNYAGYFDGDVHVTGSLSCTTAGCGLSTFPGLQINAGSDATTTVQFGAESDATSKTCFNTKNTAGGDISFYFVGTTMVVENKACIE